MTLTPDSEDRLLRAKRAMDGFTELLALIPPRETIEVTKLLGVLVVLTDEVNAALPSNLGVWGANDQA